MTSTTTDQQYARRLGTLWRDTGLHVIALPEGEDSDVVVLGGGSAVLWRLLEQPVTFADLLGRLRGADAAPSAAEVDSCLRDLVERGLVVAPAQEVAL